MTLLTTQEAADRLGLSRRQVQALCASGQLPATQYGRMRLITDAAVTAFVRQPRGRRWPKS